MSKIDVKTYRDRKLMEKDKDVNKSTVTFGNYDFSYLVDNCFGEKTPSGRPIFKTIHYLRNQERKGDIFGEMEPFLPGQSYINLKEINHEIADIRLLLEYLFFNTGLAKS